MDEMDGRERMRIKRRDSKTEKQIVRKLLGTGPAKIFHQIDQRIISRGRAAARANPAKGKHRP